MNSDAPAVCRERNGPAVSAYYCMNEPQPLEAPTRGIECSRSELSYRGAARSIEYRRMFRLTEGDLRQRILGCADGPASFNVEASALGVRVVSADP